MIAGNVILADLIITFCAGTEDDNVIHYTVTDTFTGICESLTAPQDKFLKALAIAIHNDGTPDYKLDYDDAESIQGTIRWIP